MSVGDRKLVRSKSGLRIVSVDDRRKSPFELPEPQWDSDGEFIECIKCRIKFDFITRRHHCRRCGHIFCSRCCNNKLSLPRMCFLDPVRLCASCANVTRKENEFYDKHLKTLINGANFNLEEKEECLFCKLSSDHRFIVFDGKCKLEPLSMTCIQKAQIIGQIQDYKMDLIEGQNIPSGMKIHYLDEAKESQQVEFVTNNVDSAGWLSALHKAIKLMQEK